MPETEKKEPKPQIEFFDVNKIPLLMTVEEAAGLARVSTAIIYQWVENDFVPNQRLGGKPARTEKGRRRNARIRIPRDEFLSWMAGFGTKGRKRREGVNQYA